MRRAVRARLGVPWAAPQVLLGLFAFVIAALFAAGGWLNRSTSAPPPPLPIEVGETPTRRVELRYVVVDDRGLERPGFADVDLALPGPGGDLQARLVATLAALRDDLVATGHWPDAVPAPAGFVLELDRRRVAVVDVAGAPPDRPIDVATEWAAVRSIVATARVAVSATEVRITVDGEERSSLWGRVALPAP